MTSVQCIAGKYKAANAAHFQFGQNLVPNGINVEVDPTAQASKVSKYSGLRGSFPPFFTRSFSPDVINNNHFFSLDDVRSRIGDLSKGLAYYLAAIPGGNSESTGLVGGIINAIKVHVELAKVAHTLSENDPNAFPSLLETNRHCSLELAHLNIGVFHLFLNKHGNETNQVGEYKLNPEEFEIVLFHDKLFVLPKEEFLQALIDDSNNSNTQVQIVNGNQTVTQDLITLLKEGTLGCILLKQGDIPKQFFDMLDTSIREACLIEQVI